MIDETRLANWLNVEIPRWLDEYKTYKEFLEVLPSAAASRNFKIIAWAMAKERFGVKDNEKVKQC